MKPVYKEALHSVRALVVLVVLCCALYPVTVYVIGQAAFRWKANGSLVDKDGNPAAPENAAGSRLLGQSFTSAGYFHPRPSAAGSGYDAASSSGTNLGPISDKFLNGAADDSKTKDVDESYAGIKQLVQAYRAENGLAADALVPGDAVTRSASGLDPHISPRNAELQVARVAKARRLDEARVRSLVQAATEGRGWGVFGEPGVNVLMLNISLDQLSAPKPSQNHVAQG
jgi:K+-transporting ATPase ATPase C chain